MGQLFDFIRYKTAPGRGGAIDFGEVRRLALENRPKIVLCGYTSYPREYDYSAFRAIATEVGALAMADVSHVAGMIAADVLPNPLDAGFDIVTTTTHKSLRGPRGGMILCRKELARQIDNSVFPGLQGGPHMNSIAAAAITFRKAAESSFKEYASQILRNALALAEGLTGAGVTLVTGGTSNHMMVADTISSYGLDGKRAEQTLEKAGIATNKQVIPDDPNPPLRPSGIRLGTPACTTRGMTEAEMRQIAVWIADALAHSGDEVRLARISGEVRDLSARFPIPGFDSLPW
jgi:glycine hydroxymethyltransferase